MNSTLSGRRMRCWSRSCVRRTRSSSRTSFHRHLVSRLKSSLRSSLNRFIPHFSQQQEATNQSSQRNSRRHLRPHAPLMLEASTSPTTPQVKPMSARSLRAMHDARSKTIFTMKVAVIFDELSISLPFIFSLLKYYFLYFLSFHKRNAKCLRLSENKM